MVNSEEFSLRLQRILEYYDISAATFADAIDVGRSSISHILSGRNKPSLDFVLKIVQAYPEVELYWLLNGKGNFPPAKASSTAPDNNNSSKASEPASPVPEKSTIQQEQMNFSIPSEKSGKGKAIKKIVIFYTDGSFDAFEN